MPILSDVLSVFDELYPPARAESWDAVGLVCGDPDAEVGRVMFAVDPVAAVVDEALEWGADLLVTHHPLYLRGVTSVAATGFKGRVVHTLIKHGIGLLVAHTNADSADPGVSDALAGGGHTGRIAAAGREREADPSQRGSRPGVGERADESERCRSHGRSPTRCHGGRTRTAPSRGPAAGTNRALPPPPHHRRYLRHPRHPNGSMPLHS